MSSNIFRDKLHSWTFVDDASLPTAFVSFSRLLCRLTPSLCLNFLGLAHLDSHISRTTLNVPVNLMNPANSVNAHDIQSTVIGGTSEAIPHYNVETTYTRFMGHLDVIPFIASGFNIYFPILVVLLCGLTLVRFGDRILHHLGVPQLLDHWIDTDNVDADSPNSLVEDAVQDGRLLLRKGEIAASAACSILIPIFGIPFVNLLFRNSVIQEV